MQASKVRKGNTIIFDGTPCKVMEFQHHTPGKGPAHIQTRLRNLMTGNSFDHRFLPNDSVERAVLEQRDMEYLYSDGDTHHFMNTESYEQIGMNEDDLGDATKWLMAGLKIQIEFYEETPIGVELPKSLELTVVETEPVLKGATASNSNKRLNLKTALQFRFRLL